MNISLQVSPENPRILPYCNQYGDVNRNKDWEVNRNRTEAYQVVVRISVLSGRL